MAKRVTPAPSASTTPMPSMPITTGAVNTFDSA